MLDTDEKFDDVIWTDECSVKLEFHSLCYYRKAGERKKLKPLPKHPRFIFGGYIKTWYNSNCDFYRKAGCY